MGGGRSTGTFFFLLLKHREVYNYGLNECSQSASPSVCKKRKARQKPLQGRLITPRKRGNINGRFCGYKVTAEWLHEPQHVKPSRSYLWRLHSDLHVFLCWTYQAAAHVWACLCMQKKKSMSSYFVFCLVFTQNKNMKIMFLDVLVAFF